MTSFRVRELAWIHFICGLCAGRPTRRGRPLGTVDCIRCCFWAVLLVADGENKRLCVFKLSGEFVAAVGSEEQSLNYPFDVLECASDGSFIVASTNGHNLIKLSRDGAKVGVYGEKGSGNLNGEFIDPTALAAYQTVDWWYGSTAARASRCLAARRGEARVAQAGRLPRPIFPSVVCGVSQRLARPAPKHGRQHGGEHVFQF
jgi:hypothetical protein